MFFGANGIISCFLWGSRCRTPRNTPVPGRNANLPPVAYLLRLPPIPRPSQGQNKQNWIFIFCSNQKKVPERCKCTPGQGRAQWARSLPCTFQQILLQEERCKCNREIRFGIEFRDIYISVTFRVFQTYLLPQEGPKIRPTKRTWYQPRRHVCIARFLLRSASQRVQRDRTRDSPFSPPKMLWERLGTRLEGTFECKARLETPPISIREFHIDREGSGVVGTFPASSDFSHGSRHGV